MEFLANENVPIASISLLRQTPHKILSVYEEMPGASDRAIMAKAHKESLIILTFDRDYGELIFKYQADPPGGLVHFRFDPENPEEPAAILLSLLRGDSIQLQGKYTVLTRERIRQRPL